MLDSMGDLQDVDWKILQKDLNQKFDAIRSLSSPSESVRSFEKFESTFGHNQQGIHFDRTAGPPVAIFEPILARLQNCLEHLDEEAVSALNIEQAHRYFTAATLFYDDEKARQKVIEPLLDIPFGRGGKSGIALEWADGIKPDRAWSFCDFIISVLELKNEPGMAGDAVYQAIVDYNRIVSSVKYSHYRCRSNFPVVILGVTANRLEIVAGVCVGAVYASRLLCLDLSCGFQASDEIIRLAQLFSVLQRTRGELEEYYGQLSRQNSSDFAFLYPNPTPLHGFLPKLKFKSFLSRTGEEEKTIIGLRHRASALYVATLLDDPENLREVVVKITPRYNEHAHRILEDAGLAPKLHFCGKVVGGVFMVIMGRLRGASLVDLVASKAYISPLILKNIREAVELLHAQNIVFGDLRVQNIFVEISGNACLVDFDWAGTSGVSRYPATLNVDNKWSSGVSRYALMTKEHDLWGIEQVVALYKS